jgi:hypothetical protein
MSAHDERCSADSPREPRPTLSYARPGAESPAWGIRPSALIALGLALAPSVMWMTGFSWLSHYDHALAMLALATLAMLLAVYAWCSQAPGSRGRIVAACAVLLGVATWFGAAHAVLNPPTSSSRPRAYMVMCSSNLKQMREALWIYANARGGLLPPDLGMLITHAELTPAVLVCPATSSSPSTAATPAAQASDIVNKPGCCDYVYLAAGLNIDALPPDYVLVHEKVGNHGPYAGGNLLYADGSSEWFAQPAFAALVAQLQAGQNPPRRPAGSPTRPAMQPR